MAKRKIIKIVSKDKSITVELTAEARTALRLKGISDKKLLRMLQSTDEADMPTSQQVRLLALVALERKGWKMFEEA